MADWIDQNGGAVKSDDGGIHLTIPPDAWQGRRQLSIAEKEVDTRVARTVGQPIRPTRAFTLIAQDETGSEVHAAFDQPVQLTIHLRSADLVRVVSPRCILYWLDPASNQWVEVPSVYDRRSGTVVAELAHFSDYLMGVGENGAITPSVDGYQVDLNSGNAEISIPLKVPPGVHGFEPKLTLTYSTGGPCGYISQFHATYEQSQASWVGLGWDLNPGYILRTNFATPEERFYLFLNNRSYDLIYNPKDGRYHTQVEDFLWVQYVPDNLGNGYEYVIACARDGTQYRFGYELHNFTGTNFYHDPPGSRMDGFWSGNGDHWEPVRYCLDEIRDPSGNVISITYSAEEGTSGSTYYDQLCLSTRCGPL